MDTSPGSPDQTLARIAEHVEPRRERVARRPARPAEPRRRPAALSEEQEAERRKAAPLREPCVCKPLEVCDAERPHGYIMRCFKRRKQASWTHSRASRIRRASRPASWHAARPGS